MADLYALDSDGDQTSLSHQSGPRRGYGHYATYHALWHLREIGVVPNLSTFESSAWKAAEDAIAKSGRSTRIALIDVSVAFEHPNLREAICTDLMIDFFSARFGAFPRPNRTSEKLKNALDNWQTRVKILTEGRTRETFCNLCDYLKKAVCNSDDWRTPLRVAPATNPAFSAHGTAMAGLIGARPCGPEVVGLVATQHIGGGDGQPRPQTPRVVGLPYVGVDPFSEIVPISTSFDPDPEQLLHAMLYALLIDADIIVLARDFPDPVRTHLARLHLKNPDTPTETETAEIVADYPVDISGETDCWDALMQLTLDISKHIPIVCAAGNAGDDLIMYPGRLARPDNGIIAVGARAASGLLAAYSSGGEGSANGVTITAPSGDGERLDIKLQRLDTASPDFRLEDHSARYLDQLGVLNPATEKESVAKVEDSIFSTQEIISTDVPGSAGYNSSAFARPATALGGVLDYRSYYCHFSGTSAATALVAGVLSLGIASGKIARGAPLKAKKILRGRSRKNSGSATPSLSWANIESIKATSSQ